MNEEWRPVKDYEGLYEVSNTGLVRRNGMVRKNSINQSGYPSVMLSKNGKTKFIPVHRMVAIAFIPNLENKRTVNHIDGNKQNNTVTNLEWATHSENIKHAYASGLHKVSDIQRKKLSEIGKRTCVTNHPRKAVIATHVKCGKTYHFDSIADGARAIGGDSHYIISCCKGRRENYKEMFWRYADEC